jgi:hypothetical protein
MKKFRTLLTLFAIGSCIGAGTIEASAAQSKPSIAERAEVGPARTRAPRPASKNLHRSGSSLALSRTHVHDPKPSSPAAV